MTTQKLYKLLKQRFTDVVKRKWQLSKKKKLAKSLQKQVKESMEQILNNTDLTE